MKKIWLVLLAFVLVFGMISCSDDSGGGKKQPENLVEKVVFDLATNEGIQALTVGTLTFSDGEGGNPIKPLMRAGGDTNITIEAIAGTEGQAIALKYTTEASTAWGAGIDLTFAAFGFRAGDVVNVTGKVTAGTGKVQLNSKVGNEVPIGEGSGLKEAGDDLSITVTLTQADVNNIKSGSGGPPGIRLEARAGGMTIEVYNINITGKRPTNIAKLEAPVVTVTTKGIEWEPIENANGYKVFCAEDDDDAEFELLSTEGPGVTSKDIIKTDLVDGDYQFKVVALGLEGISLDSDDSNVVKFTKVTPPYSLTADGFFHLGPFHDGEKTWKVNGTDQEETDLEVDIFQAAKYLIVEFEVESLNGVGGLQFAFQGNGDTPSFQWRQINLTGDWKNLQPTLGSYQQPATIYFVLELAKITENNPSPSAIGTAWEAVQASDQAKIYLNDPTGWSGQNSMTFKDGYLTAETLTRPEDYVESPVGTDGPIYGWFANRVPEGE